MELEEIRDWLKKHRFYSNAFIKEYLLKQKLTTAQIHQLYCLWHNDTRSLLRGKKDHLLFGLITTVKNESQWLGISTPCENWYEMTPDEQYNWIETKELTNN